MRGRSAWAVLVVGLVACIAVAYGAYWLAGYSWDQVVSYRSPYAEKPLATDGAAPAAPLASTVVLVIVDGMRDDVSRVVMPSLDRLRQYGSDVVIQTAEPSLSYPNWTTILTGAPQTVSGVTTNWWEGRVKVPTLMDVARSSGHTVAIIGPEDFTELYGVKNGPLVSLREWPENGYLSGTLVDDALRIARAQEPELLIIHLPDLDEAGHDFGGESDQYRQVAARIDTDLGRLISELQSDTTAFVVVSDHGHIATGGHGGWEPEVTQVPLVVSGAGARLGLQTTASQNQVASTVAVLAGMRPPAFAQGQSVRSALVTEAASVFYAEKAQRLALLDREAQVIGGESLSRSDGATVENAQLAVDTQRQQRQAIERSERSGYALAVVAVALLVLITVAAASWRAFLASLSGTAAYYAVYNLLFFVLHRYQWSLSAFNTEEYLDTFFNIRMAEAALSGLVAVAVAAAVYPLMRNMPRGPREKGYLAGWLALAPATVLVVMATLALQVGWFVWAYGPNIVWALPDFKWAFKYDLDLVQMTALGASAVLGMLVSYLVGRYHPVNARAAGHLGESASGRHSRRQTPPDSPVEGFSEDTI